jgi:golgi to ER traffic protein 4
LQQLCLKENAAALETFNTYTKLHPNIEHGPPFIKPLLNFIYFLLKTIEAGSGKLTTFKALCDLYKPSLDRDPSYNRYLIKIGCIFFNAPQPQQQLPSSGIIGELFNQLFQGLETDEPSANGQPQGLGLD